MSRRQFVLPVLNLTAAERALAMLQTGDREHAINDAITRFRQGRCPCCGKGIGEPRGMEFRPKSEDLYCHTCKKRWPMELDIQALEEELAQPKEALVELPRATSTFLDPGPSLKPRMRVLRTIYRWVVRNP